VTETDCAEVKTGSAALIALAELCEAASRPNYELERQIWIAVGSPDVRTIPVYTASMDAAITLVPGGFMWRLQAWPDGVNNAILERDAGDFGAIDARHTEVFAGSPALALCAAALRARAALLNTPAQEMGL
jgi:hypothetical protein